MQNKSKLDVTQAARDWLERGVHTVALREGTKQPINKGWQKLTLVSDDFGKHFKLGNNIGGLWGERSNWAVDLDLDLDTAPAVAPHIIDHYLGEEETLIYGRRNKPFSHYIFRCVGSETQKWQVQAAKNADPESEVGMVVEIRSTGAQSVLPPSKHPEGDRYYIEHDDDFYDIPKSDLERMAEEIAIAAVMLYFYPEQHGRHDFVHACTGSLCRAGWQPEKVFRVMQAVLNEVDDEEIKDRVNSVKNTVEHHENKTGDVRGFTSLEEFMTTKTIQQLRRWTEGGKRERMLDEPPPKPVRGQKTKELEFKEEWLDMPGLVGDIAKWQHKRAHITQPAFELATGIMCTAIASNNNYEVDTWDTPLQPYLMCLAPTGGGKGASLSATGAFAHALGIPAYRDFQSWHILMDVLAEEGSAHMLWDEAARNLIKAKSSSGPDYAIVTQMIQLYGQANDVLQATPGRNKDIPEIEHPFFTVLATAQPDMLMAGMNVASEQTGFMYRFLLFDTASQQEPPVNRQRSKVFPAKLKKMGNMLALHEPKDGDFTKIKFDKEKTFVRFQEYEETARKRVYRGKETVYSRANQNALILAGIAAVGMDPHNPVIDDYIARWAMEIVDWSCANWQERLRVSVGGETHAERLSYRIERAIRRPQDYYGSAQQPNQRKQLAVLHKGFMHPSVLARVVRIDKKDRERILDELHESGVIGSKEIDGVRCYYAV